MNAGDRDAKAAHEVVVEGAQQLAADVAGDDEEADGQNVEVFPAPDHALEIHGVGVLVAAGERADGDHTSLCLAACHSASISSMEACCGVLPCAARPSSTCAEAAAEFAVGLAQGLFGIDLQEARDVDDDEQQVADFVLDFSGVAGGAGGVDLGELFAQLVEDLIDVFPIETGAGGFGGDLLRFD